MQRTAIKRTNQYDARYDPTSWALKVAAVETEAKGDFAAFANSWIPKRDEVVVVCNVAGVFPLMLGQYLAFASKIWSTMQTYTGDSPGLQNAVAVLLAQWVSRGLSQAICELIRTSVFGISAPAGP